MSGGSLRYLRHLTWQHPAAPCDSQEMDPVGIVLLLIAIGMVAVLATMTAIGQRRRGARPATVLLAGLFFPVAWIGWYTHDELQKGQSPS